MNENSNIIIESGDRARKLVAQATLAHSAIPVFWTGPSTAILSIADGNGGEWFIKADFQHCKGMTLDDARELADKWDKRRIVNQTNSERQQDIKALKKEQ